MRKVLYIFGLLTDADIEWMARAGTRRWSEPGTVLIREGHAVDSVILVLEGELVVSVGGLDVVARLGVGEVVGEMSYVDPAPPSATVSASVRTLALFIDKQALTRKLESDIGFGFRFYKALAVFLADRLRGADRRLSYGETHSLGGEAVMADELDLTLLDTLSLAGERFHRLLQQLSAG